ncbi:MAG: hypothetical protein JXN64_09660 [Spirochaetes bacterium]|nr:hypothetical protein [Spirochaetota bacterium]
METWLPVIIQLISGAAGGNIAGSLLKDQSLGTVGNSIAGIVGGGIGGVILNAVGVAVSGGSIDVGSIVGSVAGGGVGGAVLMIIVGIIKKAIGK